MPVSISCPECANEIPQPAQQCPHCGRPGRFWNVIAAEDAQERDALKHRYDGAKADAVKRGADAVLQHLESALTNSTAVMARSESELLLVAGNTRRLFATYYQQIESGSRLPDGDEWAGVREITDSILFPNYKELIHFAALSLDGVGLLNYGNCSVTLRDDRIAHRTSVLEDNSVLLMERHGVQVKRNSTVPKGFRATWGERDKLCVAKLAGSIDSTTKSDQYSGLLLKQGASSEDDEFVEVHIFGPMSVFTIAAVKVTEPTTRRRATVVSALKSKLAKHGVPVS